MTADDTSTPVPVSAAELLSASIIAVARSQLGTPFKHQGRVPGLALDCAGLAAYVATELGVDFNEWPGYGRVPCNGLLQAVMDAQPCLEVVSSKQPGDILMMRVGREPQHLAVYTGDNTIIHAYEAVGKVCEHRLDHIWNKRIIRIYRFRSIPLTASRSTSFDAAQDRPLSASTKK